jgi:hypothetical protein
MSEEFFEKSWRPMMLQMNPPTSNPIISRKHGAGALKPVPFQQAAKPFHSTVQEPCRQIQLARISDSRGSLSFIEGENHIPFKIESARWINDDSELATAGDRNYLGRRGRQEFIVPISGSIEVTYDDGRVRKQVCLERPDQGLYVPNASCCRIRKLSANSAVLFLSSAPGNGFVLS